MLNVVEGSGNTVFEDDTPPPNNPLSMGCKFFSGGIYGLYRKGDRINFGGGSMSLYFEVLGPFLAFRVIRGWIQPHTSYFSDMHLKEILRWSFVVVKASKRAHSIGNLNS